MYIHPSMIYSIADRVSAKEKGVHRVALIAETDIVRAMCPVGAVAFAAAAAGRDGSLSHSNVVSVSM